jgi:hypothetical protein
MSQFLHRAAAPVMVGLLICCISAFQPIESPMRSFQWLLGSWESQRKSGMMEEGWRNINDSSLAGRSTLMKPDGTTQLLEEIELVYRNKKHFYIASDLNQNGGSKVSFQITQFSDSGFLAENPQHDFPRRIRYRLIGKDSILATIDAGAENPQQKVDFSFRRKR